MRRKLFRRLTLTCLQLIYYHNIYPSHNQHMRIMSLVQCTAEPGTHCVHMCLTSYTLHTCVCCTHCVYLCLLYTLCTSMYTEATVASLQYEREGSSLSAVLPPLTLSFLLLLLFTPILLLSPPSPQSSVLWFIRLSKSLYYDVCENEEEAPFMPWRAEASLFLGSAPGGVFKQLSGKKNIKCEKFYLNQNVWCNFGALNHRNGALKMLAP